MLVPFSDSKMFWSTLAWFTCVLFQYISATPIEKLTPVKLVYECAQKIDDASDKAPILLLHGLTASKENWDGTFETLIFRTGRKVCRADLRNHGDSPRNDETSVAAMAEDTIHLLDEMQAKTAVIIGHSLGGKIACHTALNYPERIESIVVEDMNPDGLSSEIQKNLTGFLEILKAAMDQVPEGTDEIQAKELVFSFIKDLAAQHNMTMTEDDLVDVVPLTCSDGKCRWKVNVDAILNTIAKGFDTFWTPSGGIYKSPALFIYGTESFVKVSDYETNIRELFPSAKLVAVQGAGHSIHGVFPQFEEEVLKVLGASDITL